MFAAPWLSLLMTVVSLLCSEFPLLLSCLRSSYWSRAAATIVTIMARPHPADADTPEYSLRFIESDDEGSFWKPQQAEDSIQLIRHKLEEPGRKTIVVTFVHGWHHSAECCDGNVEGFRNTLLKLSNYSRPPGAPLQSLKTSKVV